MALKVEKANAVSAKFARKWADMNSYATTTGLYWEKGWNLNNDEGKRMVTVYKVTMINREKEEFLNVQTVMGEGEADAMLGINLTDQMKKLKKQDKLALITETVGSFEKYEIQEVRVRSNGEFDD